MKILVTGAAGFIGFHLTRRLLAEGNTVIGLDSINDYYDVQLKYGRLAEVGILRDYIRYGELTSSTHTALKYNFIQGQLEDKVLIDRLFSDSQFDVVVNLAAQAGVRYSLTHPQAYIDSNITGYLNILEACRKYPVQHLVYASSSSVYGLNTKMPFSVHDPVNHPVSLYAASKKANELMAHTYSHLFNIPTTGLRFFSVYGPWGRPDMALFIFTKSILEERPIPVFNYGEMRRDFTYIDDIIEGVVRVIKSPPSGDVNWHPGNPDSASSQAPYRIYNIGNSSPVRLMDFIQALEESLGKTAIKDLLPIQPGDVPSSWADVTDLREDMSYQPNTNIKVGVENFVNWYRSFYLN